MNTFLTPPLSLSAYAEDLRWADQVGFRPYGQTDFLSHWQEGAGANMLKTQENKKTDKRVREIESAEPII